MSTTTTTATSTATPQKASHVAVLLFPPWVHFIVGVILIAAWVTGNIMQIQTTQAWILHTRLDTRPDFTIAGQVIDFFTGALDPRHVVAFIGAWGAQIILLCSKIGLERVQASMVKKYGTGTSISDRVVQSAKRRALAWSLISWAIIVANSIFDWNYAAQLGFWVQAFYTAVTFVTTFYCGTWGIQHLAGSLAGMKE
jgi:hypothetical protein